MFKTLLAGTTALAIAGATLAYAQQPPRSGDGARWRPTAEDVSAFTDARIAGLKAGLKLTPEQDKNWPAVETALRDLAKQRADMRKTREDRRAARASADRADPIERLRSRADAMTQSGAALKKLADAAGPLYSSLDEGQKRRFTMLARIGVRDQMRMERRHQHRHRHHRGRDDNDSPRGPRPQ